MAITYSYSGDLFVLGYGAGYYAIWDKRSGLRRGSFPLTDEGWASAWDTYAELEPQALPLDQAVDTKDGLERIEEEERRKAQRESDDQAERERAERERAEKERTARDLDARDQQDKSRKGSSRYPGVTPLAIVGSIALIIAAVDQMHEGPTAWLLIDYAPPGIIAIVAIVVRRNSGFENMGNAFLLSAGAWASLAWLSWTGTAIQFHYMEVLAWVGLLGGSMVLLAAVLVKPLSGRTDHADTSGLPRTTVRATGLLGAAITLGAIWLPYSPSCGFGNAIEWSGSVSLLFEPLGILTLTMIALLAGKEHGLSIDRAAVLGCVGVWGVLLWASLYLFMGGVGCSRGSGPLVGIAGGALIGVSALVERSRGQKES